MKVLGNLFITLIGFFLLVVLLNPWGHPLRVGAREESNAKSLFNALTGYASDHNGKFPAALDDEFFDKYGDYGDFSVSDRNPSDAVSLPKKSTVFFYIAGQSQTVRGSNLIAISEQPIIDPEGVPYYVTLTIAGKSEAMTYDDLVPILAQTIRRKAEREMRAKNAVQSQP